MVRVGALSVGDFGLRLRTGLGVQFGPFHTSLRMRDLPIVEALYVLYADYPILPWDSVFNLHVWLDKVGDWRPWRPRGVRFTVDGRVPHEDMPAAHALAVLEWGMNLVIAMRSHQYLMLHSAVVEKDHSALLLPAAPGAGKTTLSAALSLSGWRLFSDEFGLLRPGGTDLVPVPRPMALKDASIDVIRAFSSEAVLGPEIAGTRKGTVAHLKPPADSVRRAAETAQAKWIVYPQWQAGAACRLEPVPKSQSFMLLATNAFNYELQGEAGFDTVRRLIDSTESYRLIYSDLDEALAIIDRMTAG